ncbi:protein of unknown function [Candidatus Nitrospira inopinata]|uniref:Uncharacterized protein n=1 Tax=Candidatus Nitrospira inopinata TaxID=1715989 RepID=A0A0S4KV53_9BACT|nr:protein of unknown function [Candidatus Nitrospira inopinata]
MLPRLRMSSRMLCQLGMASLSRTRSRLNTNEDLGAPRRASHGLKLSFREKAAALTLGSKAEVSEHL